MIKQWTIPITLKIVENMMTSSYFHTSLIYDFHIIFVWNFDDVINFSFKFNQLEIIHSKLKNIQIKFLIIHSQSELFLFVSNDTEQSMC
jgi:hypothetical protein